ARTIEEASRHRSEDTDRRWGNCGTSLRPAAVSRESCQRSGMRRANRRVYGQVCRRVWCLGLGIDPGSDRTGGVKHSKIVAGVVHFEIARIPKEIRTGIPADTAGVTPLSSGLPWPARLIFENPIQPPTIQQAFVSPNRRKTERWRESNAMPQIRRSSPVVQ